MRKILSLATNLININAEAAGNQDTDNQNCPVGNGKREHQECAVAKGVWDTTIYLGPGGSVFRAS